MDHTFDCLSASQSSTYTTNGRTDGTPTNLYNHPPTYLIHLRMVLPVERPALMSRKNKHMVPTDRPTDRPTDHQLTSK